jgi:NAD-dependent deacetylase
MTAIDLDLIEQVAAWIDTAGRVVALSGAGVSTASGIPDYRGPNGLWTRDPDKQRLVSIEPYVRDPAVRREAWQMRAATPASELRPNAAHEAFVELERRGRLHALVTQNVDGLHQLAGSSPDLVVEVHGSVREAICLACGRRQPMGPVLDRVRAGELDPACDDCGGILKSATISFGQSLDPAILQRAHDAAMGADVFLAVGSSLVVYPVALLPRTAQEAGARLVVVNAEPGPYDEVADAVFHADTGAVLSSIVDALREGGDRAAEG